MEFLDFSAVLTPHFYVGAFLVAAVLSIMFYAGKWKLSLALTLFVCVFSFLLYFGGGTGAVIVGVKVCGVLALPFLPSLFARVF